MLNPIDLTKISESVFGISAHSYRRLAREGKVPSPERGKIDLLEATRALLEYYRSRAEAGGGQTLTDERIRLTRLNGDRRQLENEKARGQTIDTARAQIVWGAILSQLAKQLETLQQKLSPLAFGLSLPEIKILVDRMIGEMRDEMSNPDLEELAKVAYGGRTGLTTRKKVKSSKRRK